MKFQASSARALGALAEADVLPTDGGSVGDPNSFLSLRTGSHTDRTLLAYPVTRRATIPFAEDIIALLDGEDADGLIAALRRLGKGMGSSLAGSSDDHPWLAERLGPLDGATSYQDSGFSISDEKTPLERLLEAAAVFVVDRDPQELHLGCDRAFDGKEHVVGKTAFEPSSRNVARPRNAQDKMLAADGDMPRDESRIARAEAAVEDTRTAMLAGNQGERAGQITARVDMTERKEEYRLKEALEFAEGIVAAIPDTLFEADREGRYQRVWAKDPNLLAQQKALLLGKTVNDVLPADQAIIAMEALQEADEMGVSHGRCLRIPLPNGETRWFELSVAKKPSAEPSAGGNFLVLSRDITERRQVEDAFGEMRTHLVSVLQTIPDMVWLKDVAGVYLLCNHAFARLVGRAESDIIGKTDQGLFGDELAQCFREKDQAAIEAGRIIVNEEWVASCDTRQPALLETRKVPVLGANGQVTGILGVARDITELNASRQKIHQMAFYDSLTALPNRVLFHDRLRQMIADSARHGQAAGVMLIDMDHFKAVNDTMGHPVGDELLCQAAARLNASVRAHDVVARLGGDEFAILLPEIQQRDDLSRIANRIFETFKDRFLLDGREVFISCSIGIALYPDDSTDADDLVKYADSAMYFAKRSGRSNFRFYSKDLTTSAEERLRLESELRRAVERGELELHYQPKVQLEKGMMVGSEALLRWRHPQLGMVPPNQFIPIAEETGLITDLGRWVLREACQTAAELNSDGQPLHKVAINLTAREFKSQDLPRTVADVMNETSCRPEWLEIEITESLLLDEKNETLETLSALRSMGVTIAIDDFGTGYSALSYLLRFPVDTLKIDRSFINSADKRSAELVKAILSIARCMGQSVVAEGVETVEQAAFLTANGCDAAQGFLFSRPVPKSELFRLPRCFREIGLLVDTASSPHHHRAGISMNR